MADRASPPRETKKQQINPITWLEAFADVSPRSLIQHNLDLSGLVDVIKKLIAAVVVNAKQQDQCRAECDRCLRALEEMQEANAASLVHRKTISDQLSQIQREVRTLHATKVNETVFNDFIFSHKSDLKELHKEMEALDGKKLDAGDPQLERDSRRHALETVKEYTNSRTAELRNWVERKLEALGTALRSEDERVADKAFGQLQSAVVDQKKSLEDLNASLLQKINRHTELLGQGSERVTRVLTKLSQCEVDQDTLTEHLEKEVANVSRKVTLLQRATAVTEEEWAPLLGKGWDHPEIGDLELQKRGDFLKLEIKETRLKQWNHIFESTEGDEQERHHNESQLQDIDEHRAAIEEHYRKLADDVTRVRRKTALQWITDDVVAVMLQSPVFVELRNVIEVVIDGRVTQAKEDLTEDLSRETQNIIQDLKSKINAQRCIELIGEQVGDEFMKAQETTRARLQQLESEKISVAEAYELLRQKVDLPAMEGKADKSTVNEMFEFVNNKLGQETPDDALRKSLRTLHTRVDELRRSKLEKDDPVYLAVIEAIHGGALIQAPVAGRTQRPASAKSHAPLQSLMTSPPPVEKGKTAETCISCMRPTSSPSSTVLSAKVEDIIEKRERDKQVTSEGLSIRAHALDAHLEVRSARERRLLNKAIDVDQYLSGSREQTPGQDIPLTPAPPPGLPVLRKSST